MRLSIILKNKISFVSVMLALVLGLGMLTTTVNAQKSIGPGNKCTHIFCDTELLRQKY